MGEGYRTILGAEDPKGFTSRVCGRSYKEEEQAQDCCNHVIYSCAICGNNHDSENEAEACCEHVKISASNSIKIYQCNWCYRKHVAQSTAKKCCPERNYKCSNCGELFTIQQFMNNEICSCERRIHQVILF